MDKKKVIIAVVLVVLVVGILVAVLTLNKGSKIDLAKVNEEASKIEPFSQMATQDIDKQIAAVTFGIDEEIIENAIGKFPLMNVQASMYVVIQAKDGKINEVYDSIVNYGNSYEQQWSTYLPEQYDLVTKRKVGKTGNYAYIVVSENPEKIVNLIK